MIFMTSIGLQWRPIFCKISLLCEKCSGAITWSDTLVSICAHSATDSLFLPSLRLQNRIFQVLLVEGCEDGMWLPRSPHSAPSTLYAAKTWHYLDSAPPWLGAVDAAWTQRQQRIVTGTSRLGTCILPPSYPLPVAVAVDVAFAVTVAFAVAVESICNRIYCVLILVYVKFWSCSFEWRPTGMCTVPKSNIWASNTKTKHIGLFPLPPLHSSIRFVDSVRFL